MSFTFLIPIAIFLIAAYFFKNSTDEISYLAALISLISLFFSLVLAPWQLQLLLLVLILFSNRRQSVLSKNILKSQEEEKIKLLYRGANYELPIPTSEVTEVEVTGKYRGQIWRNRQLVKAPASQQPLSLKDRGASVAGEQVLTPLVKETLTDSVEDSTPPCHQKNWVETLSF